MVTTTVLLLTATLSAAEMLARSIAYHDSDGRFATSAIAIELSESRPDGGVRKTSLVIDNGRGRFEMQRVVDDGREVYIRVDGDDVKVSLDGSTTFSAEEAEQYRLAPEQAKRTRNYYIYLYGLPMKLLDSGTRLDPETREKEYQGHAVESIPRHVKRNIKATRYELKAQSHLRRSRRTGHLVFLSRPENLCARRLSFLPR